MTSIVEAGLTCDQTGEAPCLITSGESIVGAIVGAIVGTGLRRVGLGCGLGWVRLGRCATGITWIGGLGGWVVRFWFLRLGLL